MKFKLSRIFLFYLIGFLFIGCGGSGTSSTTNNSGNTDGNEGSGQELCGNNRIDAGEACDDGNTEPGDGCSADCKVIEAGYTCPIVGKACTHIGGGDGESTCGNGKVDANETCDDGNTDSGDGCDSTCKVIEEGYTCPPEGGVCWLATCGNGHVDPGETCDEGNNNLKGVYSIDGTGCSVQCKAPTRSCGDSLVTHEESCDDGNRNSGDGCSSDCKLESGYICRAPGRPCQLLLCSNGKIDPGELCDDGNLTKGDGCDQNCRIETGWVCPKTDVGGAAPGACRKAVCGDKKKEADEGCDDGNTTAGDGCSATCTVEAGYLCPTQGERCIAAQCGDGIAVAGEECDDGNETSGDGCSRLCKREEGYNCPTEGGACTQVTCGNGIVEGPAEQCDDGNRNTFDGCDRDCQLMEGYHCPEAGKPCKKTVCGDGKVEGLEQCDTGTADSTGCVACKIEAGYSCPTPGTACTKVNLCGNGVLDPFEQCDDGNTKAVDGCSPECEIEAFWECEQKSLNTPSHCRPVCGDGMVMTNFGEQCDDGNLANGDGCSSNCKVESGFSCKNPKPGDLPQQMTLPVTYRDFRSMSDTPPSPVNNKGWMTQASFTLNGYDLTGPRDQNDSSKACFTPDKGHPDFDRYSGSEASVGLVAFKLDREGKPVAVAFSYDGSPQLSCSESYSMWYRNLPGLNATIEDRIVLQIDPATHAYVFDSQLLPKQIFTPIDNKGFGNSFPLEDQNWNHNYAFTSEVETYFVYSGDEVLSFTGDDDLWVFINNRLALDLGGLHPPRSQSVTLDAATAKKLKIYKGGIYSVKLFHAERHQTGSNFKLTLKGFVDAGLSVCSPICGDGIVAGKEECDLGPAYSPQQAKEMGCNACKRESFCGNGKLEPPFEQCDDGKDNGKPGKCPKGCLRTTCGNGTLDDGEECDKSAGITGSERCLPNCHKSTCGDGFIDKSIGEECDSAGVFNDQTLCTHACKLGVCGDGEVTPALGEVCDDGINDGRYGGCGHGCSFKPPHCGDGVIQADKGETCDDGINDGSFGGCTKDCKIASFCGDGIVDPKKEGCDDGNTNDGDGCSKACTVESGYTCSEEGPNKPSVCYPVIG